ncbi:MAG TPA: bifunctional oligoribonuclease/PAP phosphatase NrnA [Thermoflexia bacterium]|nr:bifunctional oligoribonuclease/PAP phosphatase NrnA [Thermoflexia bacterium]
MSETQRPLLVTHVAPDGDAIGSLLGLGWTLLAQGKSPTLACQDVLPRRFAFLPGFEKVVQDPPPGPYDLLIVLDCSDLDRIGQIGEVVGRDLPLLNIDHHVTNTRFGTVDLVAEDAVSTTHLLYHLLQRLNYSLDERIATCLLTGLVTDTRGFRTANVTPEILRIAVELMEAGAPLTTITRNGLDRRPLAALRLWGAGLARLQSANGIVWTTLPVSVQQTIGHDGYGDAGLANLLISAEEAKVSVVFTEQPDGEVEVGFRATPGFDVSRIALQLGGGGHALAAGCRVPGPLEEAQRRVLALLREDLARQRQQVSPDDKRHPQPE